MSELSDFTTDQLRRELERRDECLKHGKCPACGLSSKLSSLVDCSNVLLHLEARGWQPMKTAPVKGYPIQRFHAVCIDGSVYLVHWASDRSGEEQPPFEGFFESAGKGCGYRQVDGLVGWRPLQAKK